VRITPPDRHLHTKLPLDSLLLLTLQAVIFIAGAEEVLVWIQVYDVNFNTQSVNSRGKSTSGTNQAVRPEPNPSDHMYSDKTSLKMFDLHKSTAVHKLYSAKRWKGDRPGCIPALVIHGDDSQMMLKSLDNLLYILANKKYVASFICVTQI
jgi:hypothetical protein